MYRMTGRPPTEIEIVFNTKRSLLFSLPITDAIVDRRYFLSVKKLDEETLYVLELTPENNQKIADGQIAYKTRLTRDQLRDIKLHV